MLSNVLIKYTMVYNGVKSESIHKIDDADNTVIVQQGMDTKLIHKLKLTRKELKEIKHRNFIEYPLCKIDNIDLLVETINQSIDFGVDSDDFFQDMVQIEIYDNDVMVYSNEWRSPYYSE